MILLDFLGIGLAMTLLLIAGAIFVLLLPLLALIDILISDFKGSDKLIWVLVVIFLSTIGAVLYLLIGREQKIKKP
ncbi:MAG: PLDc N-terminal domain-containing protein [Vicingaceae bacterium]